MLGEDLDFELKDLYLESASLEKKVEQNSKYLSKLDSLWRNKTRYMNLNLIKDLVGAGDLWSSVVAAYEKIDMLLRNKDSEVAMSLSLRRYSEFLTLKTSTGTLRILGNHKIQKEIYFCEIDLSHLLQIRRTTLAKTVSRLPETEKKKMRIKCVSKKGTESLRTLNAITWKGLQLVLEKGRDREKFKNWIVEQLEIYLPFHCWTF